MNVFGERLVAVEPEGTDNTTKAGLIIEKEAPPVGVVVGGVISMGARVLYRKYAGTEVTLNGSRRVILDVQDVLAILDTNDIVG